MSIPMQAVPGYLNTKPGIQVGTIYRGGVSYGPDGKIQLDEEQVRFLQQIGVEWVMVNQVPAYTEKCFRDVREALEARGLKLYRLANLALHNMPEVTLNLPGREEKIQQYLEYIRNLGAAGIHYATYAHMGNGIWRGDFRREVRGGAIAGGLDLGAPSHTIAFGEFSWPLSHGREYCEEELWDNYETFIRRVVPVAEDAGVFIGIHPDDPPVYSMAGVPRPIFGTFSGYKRALELADSPNIGACLCVGCWLEGGTEIGSTPEEFVRYFGGQKKLFKVHMRNVTAPLSAPGGFNETFPDAGYGDLMSVFRALREVSFDGCIINDHLIDMVGGYYAVESYFTAYLKGAADAVQGQR